MISAGGGAPLVGTTISHCGVLEKLGGRGMGVVFKAEDTTLGRPAALQFLPEERSSDKHALERDLREGQGHCLLQLPERDR